MNLQTANHYTAMNKDFSFPGPFIRGLFHIPVSFHRKYIIFMII